MNFPNESAVRVPPPGSIGEAVNIFFDRTENMLPTWVSKKWAYAISFLIALLVLLIAEEPIRKLKKEATSSIEQVQWLTALMLTILVMILIQTKVADTLYSVMVVSANKQHCANTYWIGEYAKSLRQSASLMT